MRKIAIVGGGSSSLILAAELNSSKYEINLYEKNAALGRKFLVAGNGGLNLTHSESAENFITKYSPYTFLEKAFHQFSNKDFIEWLNRSGIEIFIGTSGRVFPKKGIKPVEVLNILLEKVKNNNVCIHAKHEWKGFSENGELLFLNAKQIKKIKADYTIFSLGGASWSITGSSGEWLNYFQNQKIDCGEFEASNCAYKINWEETFISTREGKALKNIAITCSGKTHFGEVVLTRFGIEGSGIYPLSPEIRQQLKSIGSAKIKIDLKPNFPHGKIYEKLKAGFRKNTTTLLKEKLNLSALAITLLKNTVSKEDFLSAEKLAVHIKGLELIISSTSDKEEAISTVGGVKLNEIDENFELKKMRRSFVIGEMLDYDAPTGGYLLQSCFSMGKYLANYLNSI